MLYKKLPHKPMKVTVIMPVYNAGKYIKEAINSILKQSFIDFELLIIDDGSTDNSLLIIESFKNSKIRVLQNITNQGLVFTRNRGIDEAKGEYMFSFWNKTDACQSCFGRVVVV